MRLIDADALKNAFSNMYREDYERWIKEVIDNAPTVERIVCRSRDWSNECTHSSSFEQGLAQGYEEGKNDRPKGKWIVGNVDGKRTWICSECGAVPSDWVNKSHYATTKVNRFCRYCGADMRSVDEGLHARAMSDLSKAVDDAYKKARGDV